MSSRSRLPKKVSSMWSSPERQLGTFVLVSEVQPIFNRLEQLSGKLRISRACKANRYALQYVPNREIEMGVPEAFAAKPELHPKDVVECSLLEFRRRYSGDRVHRLTIKPRPAIQCAEMPRAKLVYVEMDYSVSLSLTVIDGETIFLRHYMKDQRSLNGMTADHMIRWHHQEFYPHIPEAEIVKLIKEWTPVLEANRANWSLAHANRDIATRMCNLGESLGWKRTPAVNHR